VAKELEKRHTVKSLCDEPLGEWVFKRGFEIFHGQVLHRSTWEREHHMI